MNVVSTGISARRAIACAAGCAALVLAAAGCGSSASKSPSSSTKLASFYTGGTPGGTPVKGGTITVDQGENVKSLDPVKLIQPSEVQVDRAVFDQLFEYLPGNPAPQPALAQSYSVSNNGLTYIFHIRPGVKFSNGEPVTGEDVVYSLNRQKLPIAAIGTVIKAKSWQVSLVNPMTVKLQLQSVMPSLIGDMGLVQMSIVPKKVLEKEGETAFASHPVGSGAFAFSSSTSTFSTVKLARNPNYWRSEQPYVDNVVFNEVLETNARILAVRTGAATIATGISFSQVASLKGATGVRMLIEPLQDTDPVFFQLSKPPFNNVNVRRALNYATPREEIIKAVFKGLAEPANAPAGHLQYWNSKLPAPAFDLAKAKQLLKESPYPHGFSTNMILPAGEPDAALVASILQSTWAKIGVHVNIQPLNVGTWVADQFASKYELSTWNDEGFVTEQYPNDLTMYIDFTEAGGTNALGTNYKNMEVVKLLEEALGTQNETTRRERFYKAEEILMNQDPPLIAIAEIPSRTLVSASLRGFTLQPGNAMRLEQAWLAQ